MCPGLLHFASKGARIGLGKDAINISLLTERQPGSSFDEHKTFEATH